METELIRDRNGGATAVEFSSMATAELRRYVGVFPAADQEYLKRLINANHGKPPIPKSG